MHKNIYISIISVFLLIDLISGVMIIRHFREAHTQEEIYDSIIEIVEENETTETTEATEGGTAMLPDYAKLYEKNSDIVGWIRIDDTHINYPVMQSPLEPKLEAEIMMSGVKTVCERCGVPIEKHSNRQKYCPDCARLMYLKNKVKYQRKKRSGVGS